ncbi:phage tail tube protein [Arthrobacter sp. N1]|uniref:phage tail tube protein n=1 Tax=Arthrobacter sp. N1 TaxID=619291 RepID=UPI003BAFBF9B
MSVDITTPITPGIAADWVLEVAEYGDGTAPDTTDFKRVRGIQNYTPPSATKNLEDDSDFDSGAWGSQVGTGLSHEASGTVKVPRASLAADPGQAILREAGRNVAEDGFVYFRTYKRGGTQGVQGIADASFTEGGGSRTDLTTAEFTLAGRGALAPYAVAAGAGA